VFEKQQSSKISPTATHSSATDELGYGC